MVTSHFLTINHCAHCSNWLFVLSSRDTDKSYQWFKNKSHPLDIISDMIYQVFHHLTLASCWLSFSVRALMSQSSACRGLCLLAGLRTNRWGDCSLGEGSRDTISGDRWLTTVLRAGRRWDVLLKKVRSRSRDRKCCEFSVYKKTPQANMQMCRGGAEGNKCGQNSVWYVLLTQLRVQK